MLGWLLFSVLLIQGVSGCRSRSGEDSERNKVFSHKGTEPTWDKDAPIKSSEIVGDSDENKAREDGEIKVNKHRKLRCRTKKNLFQLGWKELEVSSCSN